jgi:hypothetical protein
VLINNDFAFNSCTKIIKELTEVLVILADFPTILDYSIAGIIIIVEDQGAVIEVTWRRWLNGRETI